MTCVKCGNTSTMVIDTGGNLFECLSCNTRFHRVGFQPSEIDATASLTMTKQVVFNGLLRRTE